VRGVKKDGEIRMTQQNQTKNTTTLQTEGRQVNKQKYFHLYHEGQALTTAFKKLKTAFKKSITEGFDFRLGTLIKQIKEAEGTDTLSNKIRKKYNIDAIDRRRTSEAEWLIDNSQSVADFVKKTKFSGTSIPSLQNAMRRAKSAKADTVKVDAKASDTASKEATTTDVKTSEVSNIGQSDTKVENFGKFETKSLLTANDIALEMLVQADTNKVPHKELITALIEQIKLLTSEEVA